jgi:hypothetical protein
MLGSYRVYDADAHVILVPAMWEDLPEKYVPRRPRRNRMIQPRVLSDKLPSRSIRDYLKSGRIFMCGETDDPLMKEEIALLGEDQLLYPRRGARRCCVESAGAKGRHRNAEAQDSL